jgi:hypothetical protein
MEDYFKILCEELNKKEVLLRKQKGFFFVTRGLKYLTLN